MGGADQKLAEPGRANFALDVEPFGQFKLPQKVDLFWITQNYHDLHIAKYGVVDMADFNRRVFAALKPGGVYFILDHQANPGETEADVARLHRIGKGQVIAEVTAAGSSWPAKDGSCTGRATITASRSSTRRCGATPTSMR